MSVVASILVLFAVLVPQKQWYAPDAPIQFTNESDQAVRLVAMTFLGRPVESAPNTEVAAGAQADLKMFFPAINAQGTYIVLAVPPGKPVTDFVGTPLLVEARTSPKFGGPVGVTSIKVQPLVYAELQTSMGQMDAIFWFDVAPNTSDSFISLAAGGYYDDSSFHRIVKDYVIQGGDLTGTGFGGPGYFVQQEFSDRPHDQGVLSMARTPDPLEGKGVQPRSEFANSAGSQFFICLTREKTQTLDRKFTSFGQIVSGLEVMKQMGEVPVEDTVSHRPVNPPKLQKVVIRPVTAQNNPYELMMKLEAMSHDAELAAPVVAPAVSPTTPATAPVTADPAPVVP